VNHYGQTKLIGENSVRKSAAKFAILRIPLQYGMASGLPACPMLATSLNALRSPRPWPMEDSIVRYPTYSGDVADALIFILSRSLEGVFHFSGQDKTTRYKMTIEIGKILGLDPSNVLRLENPPQGEEARPKDSHLSADKLFRLGFPKPLSFSERIKSLRKLLIKAMSAI